jgi:ABC-type transport system involved in cytochrome c biogenesis permease component
MSVFTDNPVFRREARSRLRHVKRSVKGQSTAAAALVVIISLCYVVVFRTSARYHIGGDELWLAAVWLQLLVGLAVLPAVTATAICVERQQGSLDLLLATPLTNAEIVLGKYLARMVLVGMMLAAAAPFEIVALCRGMEPGVAALSLLLLLLTLGTAGALALMCSALFRVTATAVGVAYSAVGAWVGGPAIAAAVMSAWAMWSPVGRPFREAVEAVEALSPIRAMALVPELFAPVRFAGYQQPDEPSAAVGVLLCAVGAALLGAFALRFTVAWIRRG